MPLLLILSLITLVGFMTMLGAGIAYRFKGSDSFLPISVGVVIGTMLYMSFMVLVPEGSEMATAFASEKTLESGWINLFIQVSFFLGILILSLLEKIIPSKYDIHHLDTHTHKTTGLKTTIIFMLVILMHNIPEGFAILATSMGENTGVGIVMLLAVAMHNIPQGFSLAVLFITNNISKKVAFFILSAAVLSQPIGALGGYMFFGGILQDSFTYGLILVGLAGMIVYLCIDHLLPLLMDTYKKSSIHKSSSAIIFGMFSVGIVMVFEHLIYIDLV